jgi:hypothetical protein
VDLQDELAARAHRSGFTLAQVTDPYDFSRDGRGNATDELIARHNRSHALLWITVPAGLQLMAAVWQWGAWLDELGAGQTTGRTVKKVRPAESAVDWVLAADGLLAS